MKTVISPGDRVSVEIRIRGYLRGKEPATVLNWSPSGQLKIKFDKNGTVKVVSPENVKKVADKPGDVAGNRAD